MTTATKEQDWAFLERRKIEIDITTIGDEGVPIGLLTELHNESPEYTIFIERLKKRLSTENRSLDKLEVTVMNQIMGVPAPENVSSSLLDYCRSAVDFLHQEINGCETPDISWVVNQKLPKRERQMGFGFLMDYIHIRTAIVRNPANNAKVEYTNYIEGPGGRGTFELNNTGSLLFWDFVVAPRAEALTAIFSETIPAAVLPSISEIRREYRGDSGYSEVEKIEEAFSEAASYRLALKHVENLNVPNGIELVMATHRKLIRSSKRYELVPAGIELLKKHGIQAVFDCYKKRPHDYVKALKSV